MYPNFYAELRKRRWKQKDLADFLGITLSNVNLKLMGKQGWNLKDIKKVLKEFNVSFEYLFEER